MSFDWQKYLVLADSLYNECGTFSNKEACLRSAVSRGYYAAFCTARNFARDNDRLTLNNTGRDHHTVKQFYSKASDPKRKQIGVLLGRLRNLRNQADYVDAVPQREPDAQAALHISHQIINLLQAIHTNP